MYGNLKVKLTVEEAAFETFSSMLKKTEKNLPKSENENEKKKSITYFYMNHPVEPLYFE